MLGNMSLQAVYHSFMQVLPMTLLAVIICFFAFISWLISGYLRDKVWQNNIEYHMDDVYRDEIQAKDELIKHLQKELESSKIKYGHLLRQIKIIKKALEE